SWTYSEFDGVVSAVQGGLRARGVEPGARIPLTLRNSPAFVAIWLAAVDMGACIVPCDPQSSQRELAHLIERTLPRLGVSGGRSRAALDSAAAQLSLDTLHVDEDDTELESLRGASAVARSEVLPEATATAAIMLTSGTTSAPKGVVVTQANYAFAGDVMAGAA